MIGIKQKSHLSKDVGILVSAVKIWNFILCAGQPLEDFESKQAIRLGLNRLDMIRTGVLIFSGLEPLWKSGKDYEFLRIIILNVKIKIHRN